jgi:serine/threonine-protein kinase
VSRRCPSCGTSFSDEVFFCGHDGTITVEEQDPSDHDPRLGEQLGQYIVVARVADGAMGRVYEGRHPETKARMAIKVLHHEVAKDQVPVERLKREFETTQMFDHPNIVDVLELGETGDGSWFMTMEYLQGEELGQLLQRDGPLPPERLVRLVCQVALALEHAHSFGVIHRDLKPDNIFLARSDEGDVAKILDFGSVKLQMETGPKLTAFGTTLGSPYYMSPEQAMGKHDVDQRTDVFALAAIIHEMITGKVAFYGEGVAEILMKIVNESPPPASSLNPAYPPALDDVLDKGLRKEKERRHGSTTELARAVLQAFGLEGTVEQWARSPTAQIADALAQATPPEPKPFGSESTPPPAQQPQTASQAGERSRSTQPPTHGGGLGPGVLVALALLGVVSVGGVVLLAYLLLT